MDRDPGDFEDHTPAKPIADMSEDEFTDWLWSLPPTPGLPSTPEEIAAADARAEADVSAGRVYSHEVVKEWLKTWGGTDRRPFKEWLAARNG